MTQFINKSIIKAEIERLIKEYRLSNSAEAKYRCEAYNELLDFLDTIKVKEIGFDLGNNNKECHRVPSTTLKRLYMNEAKYELLKSDIMEGIVGDFEKGTTHNYLTIKIPMLLCPSNCTKGDKVKLIIIKEE